MPISTLLLILLVIGSVSYALYLHRKATSRPPIHTPAPVGLAPSATVKVVVYVPDAHADEVRQAIGQAGAGKIGNYSDCTFSSLGTGRYLPEPGAHPMIGTVGVHERVEEERIEFTCDRKCLAKTITAIKKVHPYEEIVIDIYPLEPLPEAEPVHSH